MKANSISVRHIGKHLPKHSPLMWNDEDEGPDERARDIEEQVELRRRKKTLAACELPVEFRLITPHPKQFWIHNQLVWGFQLAWAKVDGKGNRGADEHFHVARYEQCIADDVQMRWALEDFTRKLEQYVQEKREQGVPLIFSMRMAS